MPRTSAGSEERVGGVGVCGSPERADRCLPQGGVREVGPCLDLLEMDISRLF